MTFADKCHRYGIRGAVLLTRAQYPWAIPPSWFIDWLRYERVRRVEFRYGAWRPVP